LEIQLLIYILIFFIVAIIGIPTSFALLIPPVFALFQAKLPLTLIAQRMFGGINSFILLAVPLFIISGNLFCNSKNSDRLFDFITSVVGYVSGGLAYVTIIASMIFGGISGSSTADTAGVGSVLIPKMKEKGYPAEIATAITAVSSTLGSVIPPSIIMIVIGSVLNVSIAGLFIGGIIPGILIGAGLGFIVFTQRKKYNFPKGRKATFKEIFVNGYRALPIMGAPIIIVGGILSGIFTATEAGVIAVIYIFFLAIIYRSISLKELTKIIGESMALASTSIFCLASASMFSWFLAYYKLPDIIQHFMFSISQDRFVLLLIYNILFLIVGGFLDAIPAILIFLPLLFPTMTALGINPIHLGVITTMNLAIGLVTPPYGLCALLSAKIGKIPDEQAFKAIVPYLAIMVVVLFIVTYIPQIVLFLPNLVN